MSSKYLVAILFIVTVAWSCKKPPLPRVEDPLNSNDTTAKDTTPVDKPSPYLGTWDYSKILLENGELTLQGSPFGTFTGVGKDIDGFVTITEKPNRFTSELTFTAALNIMVFGQAQQNDIEVPKNISSGTWIEKNGEITLIADDGSQIAVISSTSSKVVFTGNFDQEVPLGPSFSLDANSDVVFTITK